MKAPGTPTYFGYVYSIEGARKKSSVCTLSHVRKNVYRGKGKRKEMGAGHAQSQKAHIVRTNMFLPEGARVIGVVASASLTVSFSGSLSPGFTWVLARSAATWEWADWAAPFTRLATVEDILVRLGVLWSWSPQTSDSTVYIASDKYEFPRRS